jgi:hypothetical protein
MTIQRLMLILHSEISTYPKAILSATVRESQGKSAKHFQASTPVPLGEAEHHTSLTPNRTSTTQHSLAAFSASTSLAYSYPDPSETSFYPSLPQQSTVFNPDSQRPPPVASPSTALSQHGTYNREAEPWSPRRRLPSGPRSIHPNINPAYTPYTANTPESQTLSTSSPANVTNSNIGDMTKFADLSENQTIDPLILPSPEGSPVASRVKQAELSRLESSIAGEPARITAESKAQRTSSFKGDTDSGKQEQDVQKAAEATQTSRKKNNTTQGPQAIESVQGIASTQMRDQVTQKANIADHGGRQYKKVKRNHRGPEDNKGPWCPSPDCPQRRKSFSTIHKHVTSDKDHPVDPQPPPGPDSKVLPRPNLPTFCQECSVHLQTWQHSWQHIQTHQQDGMLKKTYLRMCRATSITLFTFGNVRVKNPDCCLINYSENEFGWHADAPVKE